jgi:ATP-dependent helicase/DNAse subunit B
MQYFFRRILYVDEPEMFEDWMTPLEKGKMIHRVLFRFYNEHEEGQRSLENLLTIAAEEIQKFPFLPSILWDLQKEAFLSGLFPAFFNYEMSQLQTTPLKPQKFEVPFGRFGKRLKSEYPGGFEKPFEIILDDECINMRGIVDRIEITENGGIVVIDYKSGNYAHLNDIENGKSLQLPIYLKAMIELLNEDNSNYYPLGAGYYQIKDEKEIKKEIIFSEPKFRDDALSSKIDFQNAKLDSSLKIISLNDFLDRSVSFAIKYVNDIRQGKFLHHTNMGDCKNWSSPVCAFEPLCRVNQSKLKHFNFQEDE